MLMSYQGLTSALLLLVCGSHVFASDATETMPSNLGAHIYQQQCMACHASDRPTPSGPPIFAVKDHVIKAYPEKADFMARIVTWLAEPDAEQALMPGAVRNFGLMPALVLTDEEAEAVASFLYDTDLKTPDWYAEHYRAEHGN